MVRSGREEFSLESPLLGFQVGWDHRYRPPGRLPVLVFEDDAQLHPQFDARLAELLARYARYR